MSADGTRALRFTDVTTESRIEARGYGMGVAAGDFNNDGWVDLYLTKFNAPNQLLRNNGDGTFTDVSKASRTDQQSWSVSASFVDIDRDGWLDLYVGNYLRYSLEASTPCFGPSGAPNYCTPDSYAALPDRLYRNRRDGTFADVSASAQVTREFGPALGVSTADFDGDGWMDIYVANDGKENQLWRNRHDGTFENVALLAGVALPVSGKAEASMGVDAGDFDDDGDEDLVMTELTTEGSNLYVNDGTGVFTDMSARSMIGPASLAFTGFGTALVRFRQRWPPRPARRQRHRAAHRGAQTGARSVSNAPEEAAAAQCRRRPVRGCHGVAAVPCSPCQRSVAERRLATSTTTATWTS